MANIFLISDTHFRHANMLHFTDAHGQRLRPFDSIQELDELMVERWNKTVRPQDHVYHLGDVSMMRPKYVREILERLQGHLRLVRGNHDIFKTKEYLEFFDEIYGVRVLDGFLLTHIPVHPESLGRFKANVHGHTHTRSYPFPYVNVSVEVRNYTPVSLEEITQEVAAKASERILESVGLSGNTIVI